MSQYRNRIRRGMRISAIGQLMVWAVASGLVRAVAGHLTKNPEFEDSLSGLFWGIYCLAYAVRVAGFYHSAFLPPGDAVLRVFARRDGGHLARGLFCGILDLVQLGGAIALTLTGILAPVGTVALIAWLFAGHVIPFMLLAGMYSRPRERTGNQPARTSAPVNRGRAASRVGGSAAAVRTVELANREDETGETRHGSDRDSEQD